MSMLEGALDSGGACMAYCMLITIKLKVINGLLKIALKGDV